MQRIEISNCYQVLGISADASLKDINSAYKKLALKYHPDKTGGGDVSSDEFRRIQQAIEILRDPDLRQKHDEKLERTSLWTGVYAGHYVRDDDPLAQADYQGWTPYKGRRWDFTSEYDRYIYSYGNSVHMNPTSEESKEDLLGYQRILEEISKENSEAVGEEEMTWWGRRRAGLRGRLRRDEEEMLAEDEDENDGQKNADGAESWDGDGDDEEQDDDALYVRDFDSCQSLSDAGSFDPRNETFTSKPEAAIATSETGAEGTPDGEDGVTPNSTHVQKTHGIDQEVLQDNGLLGPLVTYFCSKLEDPAGRYTLEDLQIELKGIVMETFCVWLESVRMSFPSAKPLANAIDTATCHHLGRWTKHFEAESCEACHRWRPIYTLSCPWCGMKACVVCKFAR